MIGSVIFALLLVGQAHGLTCWSCNNARSIEDCHRDGHLATCSQEEAFCQMEVRMIPGHGVHIWKHCKQGVCGDNHMLDCEQNGMGSECRCCCGSDNCNDRLFQCGNVEMCERPPHPQHGEFVCPERIASGESCRLKCLPGFASETNAVLRCFAKEGEFGHFVNLSLAKCVRKPPRCDPIPKIAMGFVVCKNLPLHISKRGNNYEGTSCTFTCMHNTFRTGQQTLTCRNGHWNHEIPSCVRGHCSKIPVHDKAFTKCTKRNKFGSTCRHRCQSGYALIGKSTSSCEQRKDDPSRGDWTNEAPKCQRVQCAVVVDPNNGEASCTSDNYLGSSCTFTCNRGYDLVGTGKQSTESICQIFKNEVGKWSKPVPKCVPIMCKPIAAELSHGFAVCSKDNYWGSSCIFKCDWGYDLDHTVSRVERIICDTGKSGTSIGTWSGKVPTCSPVKCMAPRRAPLNGFVTCSNENYAGSLCTFRCKRGFDLSKTKRGVYVNRCIDERFGLARGQWDKLPAACRHRIYCEERISKILNGKVQCTDNNFVGSLCHFTCNQGYRLLGKEYLTCTDLLRDGNKIAEWSNAVPKCVPMHCRRPWFDGELVQEDCTSNLIRFTESKSVLGTRCRYFCKKDGYYALRDSGDVIRSGSTTCTCLPSLEWSGPPPRCFVKTCEHLHTPQNGYEPICSKSNNFGSACDFWCKHGYKLSHNIQPICINGERGTTKGRWHVAPPTCVPK